MIARLAFAALALLTPAAADERTPVVVELVLALDSSASVDKREFALQLQGVAEAFAHPDVLEAIDNLRPLGAAVAVVQWGAPGETRVVVPFAHIETRRDAKAFGYLTGRITRWIRASDTSIGTAVRDSSALLLRNEFDGHRLVIDVSGDGADNSSVDLETARREAGAAGIVINGLPIEAEEGTLSHYYEERVITGPGSFVERAEGFEDFARAIREKLLRELRPLES